MSRWERRRGGRQRQVGEQAEGGLGHASAFPGGVAPRVLDALLPRKGRPCGGVCSAAGGSRFDRALLPHGQQSFGGRIE